jgi:hypothetical protein
MASVFFNKKLGIKEIIDGLKNIKFPIFKRFIN